MGAAESAVPVPGFGNHPDWLVSVAPEDRTSDVVGLPLGVSGLLLLWLICTAWIGAATLFWSLREVNGKLSAAPGALIDDVQYDSIAWNLSRGKGFKLDYSHWEWLRPYRTARDGVDRSEIFRTRLKGKTTVRAPLYPWLLSGLYRVAGRRWDLVRSGQIVLLSAGLAAFFVWAGWRMGSRMLPLVATVLLTPDFGVLTSAAQIMTESLGTLLVLATIVAMDRARRQNRWWDWAGAGVWFALALLARNTMIGWLVLGTGGFGCWILLQLLRRKPVLAALGRGATFLMVVALVCLPWWVRNCERTGAFAPFGSAGSIGMAGGYSDGCRELQGNWDVAAVIEAQNRTIGRPAFVQAELGRQEYLIGQESSRMAWAWAREHAAAIPALMLQKASSHLGLLRQLPWPLYLANLLLVLSAAAGLFLLRREIGWWMIWAILLSLLTTMLTWSHYGRFAIPIRPLWHLGSAWVIVAFWSWVLGLRTGRDATRSVLSS